jgi:RyR domain
MGGWIWAPEFRRARSWLRLLVGVVLLLGLGGAWLELRTSEHGIDLLIAELQLMTGNWQPDPEELLPGWFSIARVVVPLATTGFAVLLVADLAGWVRGMTRNHTLLVGAGPAADTMVARLRRPDGARGRGRRVLVAPAGDADTLRVNGVRGAKAVVVCGDDTFDTARNVASARTAMDLTRNKDVAAHLLVGDPGLALALRARRLAREDEEVRGLRVFTVDELAVRHHMRLTLSDPPPNPHLLVVGSGAFGRAVIVELARRWYRDGSRTDNPLITLVADDAEQALAQIADRWPFVHRTCRLRAVQRPILEAMLTIAERPYRSYFCDEDEQRALSTALTAATRWRPEPGSVVVRLGHLATPDTARPALFDDLGKALHQVAVYDAAAQEIALAEKIRQMRAAPTPNLVRVAADVEPVLAFARGIHESYLDDAQRRGETLGSRPALVAWEELPEETRALNLVQAAAFPRTLAAIQCTVAPRTSLADPFFFRPGDVETLARREHEHWFAEQMARGWRQGGKRSDRRKVNPLLVPWEQLSEADRSRNRAIVRSRPLLFDRVLEREGLQIVRLAAESDPAAPEQDAVPRWLTHDVVERLARLIHDSFLAMRNADGVQLGATPAMKLWDELPEDLREANRAQARDLGNKLELLEATATTTSPARPFAFAEEEIEMLARYEHDRWVSERIAAGWTYGKRDDAAKTHDLLVPWLYLSAKKQEVDREMVRGIPKLVEAAGFFITRR